MNRQKFRLAGLGVGVFFMAAFAAAQDERSDRPAEGLVLDTVVVSGTRAPRRDGAQPIAGEALRAHKVVDLAEILADEMLEADLIRKAGYGNEVSLRGFGKNNLRISLDGSLVEGACGGRKDPSLSHINLLEVERIVVRQGPFDVTKAGAYGGSVDVVTRKPEPGLHGELTAKAGSYGYLGGGGYFTGGNEWIQALFGYSYSESDQYKDGDGRRLGSFTNQPYLPAYEDWKAYRKQDIWGKLRLTPTPDDEFLFEHSYGSGEDILYPRGPFDIPHERTWLSRASYTRTDLAEWSEKLSLSVYHNKVGHYPSQEYRGNPPKPSAVLSNLGGRLENVQSTPFATFTYGVDASQQRWRADVHHAFTGALLNPLLIPDVRTLNLGIYVQAEKEIGDWTLGAGARWDWQQAEANRTLLWGSEAGNQPSRSENEPSGFLSAAYRLTERVEVFGGLGRSARMPNGVERFLQGGGNQYGNPELKPARNSEADLGVGYADDRLTLRAKAFYSHLDDFIYQERNALGHATWTNIDARIYGGDIQGEVQLGGGFSLKAGIVCQRGEKIDQPQNNNDRDLAEIPPWKTRIGLAYEVERLSALLEWVHAGRARYVDLDAGEQNLSSWDVVNLRLGYQLTEQMTLNAGVNNLLDQTYAVANSYEWDVLSGAAANPAIVNEPGRFFYASLSYRF